MHNPKKNIFFENLDSIRGIAFFLVFLWHAYGYFNYTPATLVETGFINAVVKKGHFGVNLFFVLSGFLISFLLITEKETTGTINIKYFYIRRILRIWPLYFLVLIISFFIYPLLTHKFNFSDISEHSLYYIFFLNNFDRIFTSFVGVGNDNLGVLWSIAVEEQFYLFWPLLLLILNKKYYPFLFLTVVSGSLLFRFLHIDNESVIYLHTFSVMSDLAIGSFLAYCAINRNALFNWLSKCSRFIIISLYLIFFVLFIFHKQWSEFSIVTLVLERFILSLFFAFVIGEQCFSENSPFKLGRLKWLGYTGIISYGLYCLHLYSIIFIQKANAVLNLQINKPIVFYTEFIVCFAFSLLISYISYRYFEKKILALRRNFTVIDTR